MAIPRLSVKVGKLGKAQPHAAYIARLGPYAHRLERGEILEASGSGNLPAWAVHNPLVFWEAADTCERKNGSTYREHEIALPRELNPAQRLALVQDWIQNEIGDRYAYQFALHTPIGSDGQAQPHAHLMFSERRLDGIERDPEQFFKRYNGKCPEKGGCKKDNTGKNSG
ncbi:MAG: MobA/MobL family protein, partial [Thiolinea sp.]